MTDTVVIEREPKILEAPAHQPKAPEVLKVTKPAEAKAAPKPKAEKPAKAAKPVADRPEPFSVRMIRLLETGGEWDALAKKLVKAGSVPVYAQGKEKNALKECKSYLVRMKKHTVEKEDKEKGYIKLKAV